MGFLFLGNLGSLANRKQVLGANFEQLLRAFFSCFRGQYFIFFSIFMKPLAIGPIASAVKNCMIKFSKMKQIELFCMFFGEKMFLLRAAKNLKLKCTTKRSPIAGLGV